MKRISLIIAILLTCILGLSACGQAKTTDHFEQIEDSKDTFVDSAADASSLVSDSTPQSGEEVLQEPVDVNPREISHYITGDIELDRAIELGFATKDDFSDPERLALGSDTMAASNHLVELASQEVYESFKGKYGVIKIYNKALTRFDGAVILYITATALGAEYTDSVDWSKIDEMMAGKNGADLNEKCYKLWNYSLFRELDEYPTINLGDPDINMDQMSSILTFISGHIDLRLGKRLLECEEGTTDLHFDDLMTYEDMIRAFVRLYDSDASNGYDSFDIMYFDEQERIAKRMEKNKPSDGLEFKRAVELGFVNPSLAAFDYDAPITWSEYCEMIAEMMELIDAETAAKFRKDATYALDNNDFIQVYQGSLALYRASEFLGINNLGDFSFRNVFNFSYGNPQMYDVSGYDGSGLAFAEPVANDFHDELTPYIIVAMMYCRGRTSLISFETLMPLKKELTAYLSIEDAVNSVIRLYESREDYADDYWLKKQAELEKYIADNPVAEADSRRAEILGSKTTIVKGDKFEPGETYSGTAYYVSNKGDDLADGLSPETAWASIERIRKANLLPGDAVFFERGGIYRGVLYSDAEKVTYSAYGIGDKPIITTAQELAADPLKWELYSDKDGVKIWKYHKDLIDCGSIVFDDEKAGYKVTAGWSEDGYWINEDGSRFAVEEALTEDLDFFSDDAGKCGGVLNYYIGDLMAYGADDIGYGPLYLRCDKGNPGEVFNDVELGTMAIDPLRKHGYYGFGFHAGFDCVMDNLSVRYYPQLGIGFLDGQIIQNCEICWGGGCSQICNNGFIDGRAGDAFTGINQDDVTIRNCYIHDIFTNGLDMESPDGDCRNFSMSSNLFERCESCNVNLEYKYSLYDFVFSDNIIVGPGTGWGARSYLRNGFYRMDWCFFSGIRIMLIKSFNNCSVDNNRVYYPLMFAMHLTDSESPVSLKDNKFVYADINETSYFMFWRTFDPWTKTDPYNRLDYYENIDQSEEQEFIDAYNNG